jgi:hypothetical protein
MSTAVLKKLKAIELNDEVLLKTSLGTLRILPG